uniref:Uncharacterized protein n=1 Tax=Micrurus spixii TaxID=129469 RepID=A0A2D4MQE5_9SAUR
MSSRVTNGNDICMSLKQHIIFNLMLNPLISINLGKASITDSEMLIGINCTTETLSFITCWQCGQAMILPLPHVMYNSFRTAISGLSGIFSFPIQQDQPEEKKHLQMFSITYTMVGLRMPYLQLYTLPFSVPCLQLYTLPFDIPAYTGVILLF